MNDEFYIGWEDRAPSGIGAQVRRVIVVVLALVPALGAVLAFEQRTIGVSVFEWGNVRDFTGTLRSQPYPHLIVSPATNSPDGEAIRTYHLVKLFKFGIDSGTAARFDGQHVQLKGTLIHRDDEAMIEVVNDSIQPLVASADGTHVEPVKSRADVEKLGRQTFIGEIVDSKCYLGVMNPGAWKPHRACAVRCISGGIPPILLVRRTNGPALYFLLAAADGSAVNQQVLNLVAEPVEITGEVERRDGQLILRADPTGYQRVGK